MQDVISQVFDGLKCDNSQLSDRTVDGGEKRLAQGYGFFKLRVTEVRLNSAVWDPISRKVIMAGSKFFLFKLLMKVGVNGQQLFTGCWNEKEHIIRGGKDADSV